MSQNYGLGRGLSSLIPQKKKISEVKSDANYFGSLPGGTSEEAVSGQIQEIEIFKISPNPHQPRFNFDEEKLQELSTSIREHGILQPLIVSRAERGQFELIAGERRFQAAKLAGLKKVPVIVREVSDQEKLELAIIENIQRHNLNPIEEAKSFRKLSEEFGMNQEDIAKKLGKSRSAVANKLRLLALSVEIQKAILDGRITEGHAKAILAIESPEKQKALFDLILKNNLTVRQVESKAKEVSVKSHKRSLTKDPKLKEVEDILVGKLGTKVKVNKAGSGGRIVIEYYSDEELDSLMAKIS